MLEFNNIEEYRENNRIEAKKALGGLPHSIWETYSAFANTMGGYILLGVVENKDRSFETVNLPDPDKLINEFWEQINNPKKVSVNLLSKEDVFVEEVNGDHIIVIFVPRADRSNRPVYIENDPCNCYRRNGEGDYKCDSDIREAMIRDASRKSQDMLILKGVSPSSFNKESIQAFRKEMNRLRPGHIYELLDDKAFLEEIGAIVTANNKKHPTMAGLLMFGKREVILKEFKNYSLEYRELMDSSALSVYRIATSKGRWNGNVSDFYFKVTKRFYKKFDSSIYPALCEALVNCLVHADYYEEEGIIITDTEDAIIMSNPGSLRLKMDTIKNGGISDPRNSILLKMFNLIEAGHSSGSGIPNIYCIWKSMGWSEPTLYENMNPDRVTLLLPFNNKKTKKKSAKRIPEEQIVIEYMTDHPKVTDTELSVQLNIPLAKVQDILDNFVKTGLAQGYENDEETEYRLKY